jgi:hypothetical protein
MAKRKKAKLSIFSPSQPVLATAANKEDEEYRRRDDADKIKRYAELTREPERHRAAMDHINSEHDSIRSLMGYQGPKASDNKIVPRPVARSGRKKSIRVRRTGSRR